MRTLLKEQWEKFQGLNFKFVGPFLIAEMTQEQKKFQDLKALVPQERIEKYGRDWSELKRQTDTTIHFINGPAEVREATELSYQIPADSIVIILQGVHFSFRRNDP